MKNLMQAYRSPNYWTQEQGGYTAEMMGEILKTKADTMAINLILNSFNTVYNDVRFFPFPYV